MPTLKDIGRKLGVSVTTVSRALNGFPEVNAETRQLVVETARAMNYRPNQVARKLVSGRSGMIGLVLKAPPEPSTYGHFFEIIAGLSTEFSARDMEFVLHIGSGGDAVRTFERLINRGTLDGFVVTETEVGDPRIALLLEREVPFVAHGREPGDDRYPYFDIDNAAVTRDAVAHLLRLGHRRIALLNAPERLAFACERLRGYREALIAFGLPATPALIRHGIATEAYGAGAASDMRAAAPTAFVCCNSLVAAGVIAQARARGQCVPGDLSVVAHDDALPQLDTARFDPPLTVTSAPLRDSVKPIVDLLVRRIGGAPVEAVQIVRGAPLIERASSGPAPSAS